MIVINIALVILGILYGIGSVTNFKEWYYRHDYLAIMLSVFTSILLVVAGLLNVLNQVSGYLAQRGVTGTRTKPDCGVRFNGGFDVLEDKISKEIVVY